MEAWALARLHRLPQAVGGPTGEGGGGCSWREATVQGEAEGAVARLEERATRQGVKIATLQGVVEQCRHTIADDRGPGPHPLTYRTHGTGIPSSKQR